MMYVGTPARRAAAGKVECPRVCIGISGLSKPSDSSCGSRLILDPPMLGYPHTANERVSVMCDIVDVGRLLNNVGNLGINRIMVAVKQYSIYLVSLYS
jgi:hypothetical protein